MESPLGVDHHCRAYGYGLEHNIDSPVTVTTCSARDTPEVDPSDFALGQRPDFRVIICPFIHAGSPRIFNTLTLLRPAVIVLQRATH